MTTDRFGPYELRTMLGRGGMGEVHRAVDTRKDRLVALKRLPSGLATDVEFRRRFLQEAELAARLRDPHVIPIHDYGEIDGHLFLEMRLVDGIDLATCLERNGPLPPARAVSLIAQIAEALDAAHIAGLVHRDVKPQNILLSHPAGSLGADKGSVEEAFDGQDFVYLIDFGIAANLSASQRSSSVLSGTAAYMAPERFSTGGDHRVDVYALGCVLYQTLTGQLPFTGDMMQLMWSHANAPPPRPSAARDDLPAGLDSVVVTAMAKDPDQRYATAGALAGAARRAVTPPAAGLGATSQPAPGGSPTPPVGLPGLKHLPSRWWSRRGALAGVGLAALVLASVVSLLALGTRGEPASPVVPSNTVSATISVGRAPQSVAVTPDGQRAYTTNNGANSVSVIDTSTNTVTATIPVGSKPLGVAVTPDGHHVYATSVGAVSMIDTSSNTVTAIIRVSSNAWGVAVTPDGHHVYATNVNDGSVSVIDTSSNTVTATIPVGSSPQGVAVAPDGRHTYVASGGGANIVSVIDTSSNSVTATIPAGDALVGVAVTPDGRHVYATNNGANTVSVIDTSSNTATTIPVGSHPSGVAVGPDGRHAYVTNTGAGTVSVIDIET